jgi:hypothetical protein
MSSVLHLFGRRLAGLLVALLVGATALPPALHADMDDLACEFGAARSALGTHVDANDSGAGTLHCEVCHWLRSIRAFETPGVGAPAPIAPVDAVEVPVVAVLATTAVPVRSSRAPPRS